MPKQLRLPDHLVTRLSPHRQGFESLNQLVTRLVGEWLEQDERPSITACPKCGCNELLCGYRGDIESCSSTRDDDSDKDDDENNRAC